MKVRDLHHPGGFDEETDAESRWQKHVIVAIWALVLLLIALTVILFNAESRGSFHPSARHSPPVSAWPDTSP